MPRPPTEFFSIPNSIVAASWAHCCRDRCPIASDELRECPEHVIASLIVVWGNYHKHIAAGFCVQAFLNYQPNKHKKTLMLTLLICNAMILKTHIVFFK